MLALLIKAKLKECLCSDYVKLYVVKLILYVLEFREREREKESCVRVSA